MFFINFHSLASNGHIGKQNENHIDRLSHVKLRPHHKAVCHLTSAKSKNTNISKSIGILMANTTLRRCIHGQIPFVIELNLLKKPLSPVDEIFSVQNAIYFKPSGLFILILGEQIDKHPHSPGHQEPMSSMN